MFVSWHRLTKLFIVDTGCQLKILEIMQGKMLRQVLDKMMQHGAAQNARVQVCLPDGKFYDISSLRLMENKIIGHRESHRLVFTVQAETWNMGKVLKKIG